MPPAPKSPKDNDRKDRLAQALRENLRKRKEQGRARQEEEPDPAPEPPAAS